ncbi:diguanylate cyclase [Arcobacter sp. CECT 8985]|uniref:diguanylate cyclase n=1 Tax=Arcobacter sp. CECT 8985 TaxID=1935424 RepID=UPI00100C072E|nr:diguanylate cyclase [Arcobacter sp. CECT 8985]RXJ86070.1 hypothetical protein CRU93_10445 [Arcobacter sp. CECT 8985]
MKNILLFICLCTFLFAKNIQNLPINEKTTKLTLKEKKYLTNIKNLNMCVDPDWMPMDKIQKGKHVGVGSDYIYQIKKFLNINIILVKTKNWSETLEYIKHRKCDIIPLAVKTKERASFLNFSKPYLKLPLVIVTKIDKLYINSITDIQKPLGIVKGYAFPKRILNKFPNLNIVEVDSVEDGYKKVRRSQIFGFIDTVATAGYIIQKKYFGQLKISADFEDDWYLHIAIRNDKPQLVPIINKALASIPKETHQKIFNKWIAINYTKENSYLIMFLSVLGICFIFCIIIYIIFKANKKLNNEVKIRKKIETELKRYLKVVDENILFITIDLDGKITHASKALCEISKYTQKELLEQPHHILKHEDMNVKLFDRMWNNLKANQPWKGEIKNVAKDGTVFWIHAIVTPMFNENREKIGYTSISQNITNKKRLEEISITDELTTLYNKRYFNEVFPKLINAAKRKNEYIIFCIYDIDNFKYYNDTYGHLKGDEVLNKVSCYVKSKLNRAEDLCFRLGGEEFGLVIRESNKEKVIKYIDSIREGIEQLKINHIKNTSSKYVTASFGIALLKADECKNVDYIYKLADENLYKAKNEGRNRICSN